MAHRQQTSARPAPRPDKGRAVMYHRDSSGRHDTTASEYVRWAADYCRAKCLRFAGTPEQIERMISTSCAVHGDLFLDWDVQGNRLSRPALDRAVQRD